MESFLLPVRRLLVDELCQLGSIELIESLQTFAVFPHVLSCTSSAAPAYKLLVSKCSCAGVGSRQRLHRRGMKPHINSTDIISTGQRAATVPDQTSNSRPAADLRTLTHQSSFIYPTSAKGKWREAKGIPSFRRPVWQSPAFYFGTRGKLPRILFIIIIIHCSCRQPAAALERWHVAMKCQENHGEL